MAQAIEMFIPIACCFSFKYLSFENHHESTICILFHFYYSFLKLHFCQLNFQSNLNFNFMSQSNKQTNKPNDIHTLKKKRPEHAKIIPFFQKKKTTNLQ